ncbi:DUF4595 domain-containing protein [uncultured Porphyromonas sp.]|uniref:DUF4595 domain-containing protein n=1 Tax=uncultured Porphyromonas sp. TaxID=159274 RepID=UPI0025971585|nr:DUF4595 domain-containing protein [uncultured Porphyromonas sp.]
MKKAIALLLAVSALSSCSKSKDTPVVPTPPLPAPQQPIDCIAKIKKFVVPYRIYYEVSFTYDSQKRLTSMEEKYIGSSATKVVNTKMIYSAQTITVVREANKLEDNLKKPTEYILSLDANGRAKKLVTKRYVDEDVSEGGVSVDTVEDYIYDSKGALTEYKPALRHRVTLAWLNGNMTSFAYSIPSNTDIEKREYTTIANRTYPDLNIFLRLLREVSRDVGHLWSDRFGLRSANLVSRIHQDYKTYPDSRVNLTYSYQYKLDAKGRPIEVKEITSPRSSTTYVITYLEK